MRVYIIYDVIRQFQVHKVLLVVTFVSPTVGHTKCEMQGGGLIRLLFLFESTIGFRSCQLSANGEVVLDIDTGMEHDGGVGADCHSLECYICCEMLTTT